MAKLTYVLVHGMWHGGWCWRDVVPLLENADHKVVSVTLTGLGDRAHLIHLDISLSTHVTDVVAVMEMEDLRDVVLVGHSYAGAVITGAAERCADRIRRLVYLDALVPEHGQTAFDVDKEEFRVAMETDARENGEGYKIAARSTDDLGITDPTQAEWVAERLVPHPIGTFREPVDAPIYAPNIPSTFVICTQGYSETAEACRKKGWPVLEIESGHLVMLTNPDALAAQLLSPACQ